MRSIGLLVLLLFGVVWSPLIAHSQEKPLTAEEERGQKSLFQWLDKHYNLPDLSKTELVIVTNPVWEPPAFNLRT